MHSSLLFSNCVSPYRQSFVIDTDLHTSYHHFHKLDCISTHYHILDKYILASYLLCVGICCSIHILSSCKHLQKKNKSKQLSKQQKIRQDNLQKLEQQNCHDNHLGLVDRKIDQQTSSEKQGDKSSYIIMIKRKGQC